MATLAQCAYCFETLSASLEKRTPLRLGEVEELWDKFHTSSSEDEAYDAQHAISSGDDDDDDVMDDAPPPSTSTSLRPAAVSRLLAPSPSSASSSSVPSTSSSANSKSSSRTSLFSFGRKSKAKAADEERPLFVTWNTVSKSGSKSLRGCIGTFEPQELEDGLRSYALTSAFDDTRFRPIALRELPSLECGVTLLTNFEQAPDPMAWDIGKHGLRISFTYQGRRYGATYLPDVAREQGWGKEETMVSLMRKAGWSGWRDDWRKVADLNVVRYQGDRVVMEYSAWREWRDWVDEVKGESLGKMALN